MKKFFLALSVLFAVSCRNEAKKGADSPVEQVAAANRVNSEDFKPPEEWLKKNYEENLRQVSDTSRVVFRLNWWRAHHPSVLIRVENFPTYIQDTLFHVEQYAISKVYLDEVNNYSNSDRPYLFEQRNTKVTDEEMMRLKALANELKFWELESDRKEIIDGSNWELEIYMNGKYHQVSSNSVNPAIKRIGQEMMALAKLKLQKEEMY